jgi:hypothetical protein
VDLAGSALRCCGIDIGTNDRGTLAPEGHRTGAANPAARAGDEHNLALDSTHGNLPIFLSPTIEERRHVDIAVCNCKSFSLTYRCV